MYVAGLVGGDGTETGICEQGERQRAGGGRRGEGGGGRRIGKRRVVGLVK